MTTTDAQHFDAQVGARLRALRTAARYSQVALAAAMTAAGCPTTQGVVTRVERGVQPITLHQAAAAQRVLGVTLDPYAPPPQPVTATRSTAWSVDDLSAQVADLQAQVDRLTREAQQPALV